MKSLNQPEDAEFSVKTNRNGASRALRFRVISIQKHQFKK